MSQPAQEPVPAGWYDDPGGQAALRWWDGSAWSDHTAARPVGIAGTAPDRPSVDPATPIYGPFIWLMVLLPLLAIGTLFLYQPQVHYSYAGGSDIPIMTGTVFTPGYVVMLLADLVLYGVIALLAYLDHRRLLAVGVVRPFSWPWAFLNGGVYVIGRSVIVHRVARPRGLTPIWVLIAVYVVSVIVAIVWTVMFTSQMISQIPIPSR